MDSRAGFGFGLGMNAECREELAQVCLLSRQWSDLVGHRCVSCAPVIGPGAEATHLCALPQQHRVMQTFHHDRQHLQEGQPATPPRPPGPVLFVLERQGCNSQLLFITSFLFPRCPVSQLLSDAAEGLLKGFFLFQTEVLSCVCGRLACRRSRKKVPGRSLSWSWASRSIRHSSLHCSPDSFS